MGAEAGLFANLFYYNQKSGELDRSAGDRSDPCRSRSSVRMEKQRSMMKEAIENAVASFCCFLWLENSCSCDKIKEEIFGRGA